MFLRECSRTASLNWRWASNSSDIGLSVLSGSSPNLTNSPVASKAASFRRANALLLLYSNVTVHIFLISLFLSECKDRNYFRNFQIIIEKKQGLASHYAESLRHSPTLCPHRLLQVTTIPETKNCGDSFIQSILYLQGKMQKKYKFTRFFYKEVVNLL